MPDDVLPEAPTDEYFVLPFYIVCDVSGSMGGSKIAGLNEVVPVLRDEARKDRIIADVVQLGLISFDSTARVVRPMGNMLEGDPPKLSAGGSTEFGKALTLLKATIEQDVPRLKAAGNRVYRPAVFFLTDGGPTDSGWRTAFDALTSPTFKQYPLIIPMGIGSADTTVLQSMIFPPERGQMYMVTDPQRDAAAAISEMAKVMLRTIVSSVRSKSQGGDHYVPPAVEDIPDGVEVVGFGDPL